VSESGPGRQGHYAGGVACGIAFFETVSQSGIQDQG